MENNIKKLKINLLDGEYIFDDGNEVRRIEIDSYPGKEQILKSEIMKEYDFSREVASKVKFDLYECLQEYDYEMGTNYTTKYLNVIAKEIPKQSGESIKEYRKREMQLRKELLEKAGITGVTGIEDKVSLLDRVKRMIPKRKQKRDDIDLAEHEEKDTESKQKIFVENDTAESEQVQPEVKQDEEIDEHEDKYKGLDSVIFAGDDSDKSEQEQSEDEQDEKNQSVSYEEPTEEVIEGAKTTEDTKPAVSKPKKAISRRQSIQASKRALRESRKMKNRYKQKISEDAERKAKIYKAQREREGIDVIGIKDTSTKRGKKSKTGSLANKKGRKLDVMEMRNGTILGVDENRPSAIVKTFVIETPKKESVVKRYTRKLKDRADSIRNKVCSDREKLAKVALGGVIGAIALAGVATIVPKFISIIPLDEEYTSETEIQAFDIDEEFTFSESEKKDNKVFSEAISRTHADYESILKNKQKEKNNFVSYKEDNRDTNKEKETIDKKDEVDEKDASTTYLESIRVGSRMAIDKGVYFETPEGTGKCGSFENHAGETKIISQIGIATDDGYISITTDDVNLLELKQKYPDAKFSYHIVDEKEHVLGWLTSESLQENLLESQQQVDDGIDR